MRNKHAFLCAILSSILLMPGCSSDIKDVQRLTFATALGFDYKDGKYHGYLQTVSFTNVAKVEGGYQGEPVNYVAEGVGKSPNEALLKITKTAQQEVYLKHVSAILLTENVIKRGYDKVYDALSRHPELTLSPWVFGTREPIGKIFSTNGFFNKTSLNTILHNPLEINKQNSTLEPKQLHQFDREIFELNYTTYLPSLKVNQKQWKKNQKKEPKLAYEGAIFLKNQYYKGFYPLKQLEGLRWITKGAKRLMLSTPAMSVIIPPNVKVQEKISHNKKAIVVSIRVKGVIVERMENRSIDTDDANKSINSQITKEIAALYQLGLKKDTDFLNLEHTLFRDDYNQWKNLTQNGHLASMPDLLKKIDVNVKIQNTASNKNKKLDFQNVR